MRCAGCGAEAADAWPFSCPSASDHDDIDHVVSLCDTNPHDWGVDKGSENPFIRYRAGLHGCRSATAQGWSDDRYVGLVERLTDAVERVDGRRFRVTPFDFDDTITQKLLTLTHVKREYLNVAGSHKARHLFEVLLQVEILGLEAPLAVASCGNAALAAATLARAAERDIDVFIPTDANPDVVKRLRSLGANLNICERSPGETGDPCYSAFKRAVGEGAIPFSCQGPDNGLAVVGGFTLGYEIEEQLASAKLVADRIFLQVGGGAFASGVIQSWRRRPSASPTVHPVQTRNAHPLGATWKALEETDLDEARRNRSRYVSPWPEPPHSLAHGILDDVTYDWAEIVAGMRRTGGSPVLVSEADLDAARALAREATGAPITHTGAAGLAGLMVMNGELMNSDPLHAAELGGMLGRWVVVLTGAE